MGAIGCLFAGALYQNGLQVAGIARGVHFDSIKRNGLLYYESLNGKKTQIPLNNHFQIFKDVEEAKPYLISLQEGDWIIISSKTYSLESICQEYKPYIERIGYVLILQNGIGNEEIIKRVIPHVIIYRATTTNGALLSEPGYVKHTGSGYTKIGLPSINSINKNTDYKFLEIRTRDLLKAFNNTLPPASFDHDIDSILWEKIFINIGINAIATIHNIPNGELLNSEDLKQQMENSIAEAWEIASKLKIAKLRDAKFYFNATLDVARKTAKNYNSMLQDIKHGRPTEINFLNGKIVEYANNLGLDVPINRELTMKIKAMEMNSKKKSI
jgi:2-dehydropantoate 2-reductase